jgi:threonine/homoserine/homoserine lactone efflux protein
MNTILKNTLVGFLVSFIGSLPLGYLNLIGFQVYIENGFNSLIFYILGVILIESVVIYSTLLFAAKLNSNRKLLKIIEVFSVVFMFLLAYLFYAQGQIEVTQENFLKNYLAYSAFAIGLICNALNFMQIPFWLSWNLYVVNKNYIDAHKKNQSYYVLGTLVGSFMGILTIVMILNYATENTSVLSKYLMSVLIPVFFVGMGLYQLFVFFRKYYFNASN